MTDLTHEANKLLKAQQQRVDALEDQNDKLQDELAQAEQDLARLRQDYQELELAKQTEAARFREMIAGRDEQTERLRVQTVKFAGRIGELKQENATLRQEVERAEQIVRDLCEQANVHHPDCIIRDLKALRQRVGELESQIAPYISGPPNVDAPVSYEEQQYLNVKRELDTLTQALYRLPKVEGELAEAIAALLRLRQEMTP